MNRKIIGILGLVGLVLTGCAAPEVETEQTMMGSYSSDEIMQDNGRKIEKHFQNEGKYAVSRDRYDFGTEQSKRLYTLYWWSCL